VKGWNALLADVCAVQPDWDVDAVVLSHISTTTPSGNAETDHQGGRQRYPSCLGLFLCLLPLNRRTGPYRYTLRMSIKLSFAFGEGRTARSGRTDLASVVAGIVHLICGDPDADAEEWLSVVIDALIARY
jgi:hypothetical protein